MDFPDFTPLLVALAVLILVAIVGAVLLTWLAGPWWVLGGLGVCLVLVLMGAAGSGGGVA